MSDLATKPYSAYPWRRFAKAIVPPVIWNALYEALIVGNIPDRELYQPHYSPWLGREFASKLKTPSRYTDTLPASCWTLSQMLAQSLHVPGNVMEAGVYRGGTAKLLKDGIVGAPDRQLFLFDSFEGMLRSSAGIDRHGAGDFSDTSLEQVKAVVGTGEDVVYRKGWIPDTFAGLEGQAFCFVHIDLDLYQSILDSLNFVYPRVSRGGVIVFDDYGYASCPGARRAVDDFFLDKPENPLALMTGQALVVKL